MNRERLQSLLGLAKGRWLLAGAALVIGVSGVTFPARSDTSDDLVFIHHSVGYDWLSNGLDAALVAKSYIDERNDIFYGTDLLPDSGRPDSLAPTPGDLTDMNHWILWFNDYLGGVKTHCFSNGVNRIIMFKSCFPNSNITGDGVEPGDPCSTNKTLANYKAVYRHPDGPGYTYNYGGYIYKPLEDVFAARSRYTVHPGHCPSPPLCSNRCDD